MTTKRTEKRTEIEHRTPPKINSQLHDFVNGASVWLFLPIRAYFSLLKKRKKTKEI